MLTTFRVPPDARARVLDLLDRCIKNAESRGPPGNDDAGVRAHEDPPVAKSEADPSLHTKRTSELPDAPEAAGPALSSMGGRDAEAEDIDAPPGGSNKTFSFDTRGRRRKRKIQSDHLHSRSRRT